LIDSSLQSPLPCRASPLEQVQEPKPSFPAHCFYTSSNS
jgi:hypothetical protein